MDRTILHCDLNGFYAAVECVLNPALKKVPMAVAGDPESRHGIILAKNEIAKRYNIVTAETIWQAKQKCPDLVLVPPHHSEYEKYSRLVNDIYEEFTDLVEPFGIDESWLDVSSVYNLFGSGVEIADKIRAEVKERLELTISVGVSFNKVFAKLGSDYKKPDATTEITRENYREIVWPLPTSDLLYVGKKAEEIFSKMQITTIGDIARWDRDQLIRKLGKMGGMIHDYANGMDDEPVTSAYSERTLKSVGNGKTFDHDLVGFEEIKCGVILLADEVSGRLRKSGLKCSVVSVTMKTPSFKSTSKQKTLQNPTSLTKEIIDVSMELIHSFWNERTPVRSITITGMKLVSRDEISEQISMFAEESFDKEKADKIDIVMDSIREKYGSGAIGYVASKTIEKKK